MSGSSVPHDEWADIYDAAYAKLEVAIADVPFYVEEAVNSGGPVLELACGTGRVAIPIAQAGVPIVGLDHSPAMLAVAQRKAEAAGLDERRLHLVQDDMREFSLGKRFSLVIIPFRSFLLLETVEDQKRCLASIAGHLAEGGRLIMNFFVPSLNMLVADWSHLRLENEFTHPETGRQTLVWGTRVYDNYNHSYPTVFSFRSWTPTAWW